MTMVGESIGDELAKHPPHGDVDFRDQIDDAFLVDHHVAPEARHLQISGAHDRFDCGRQEEGVVQ